MNQQNTRGVHYVRHWNSARRIVKNNYIICLLQSFNILNPSTYSPLTEINVSSHFSLLGKKHTAIFPHTMQTMDIRNQRTFVGICIVVNNAKVFKYSRKHVDVFRRHYFWQDIVLVKLKRNCSAIWNWDWTNRLIRI